MGEESSGTSDSTVKYVNRLLFDMYRNKKLSFILRQSQPLPSFPDLKPLMPMPDFAGVCNRLKILSNLAPVDCVKLIEGTIEIMICEVPFVFRCYFDEQCVDPYCQLTAVKKDSKS